MDFINFFFRSFELKKAGNGFIHAAYNLYQDILACANKDMAPTDEEYEMLKMKLKHVYKYATTMMKRIQEEV